MQFSKFNLIDILKFFENNLLPSGGEKFIYCVKMKTIKESINYDNIANLILSFCPSAVVEVKGEGKNLNLKIQAFFQVMIEK